MSECSTADAPDDRPELEFAEQYVAPIIYEDKTATIRLDASDLELLDHVKATNPDGREFATLQIRAIATTTVYEAIRVLNVFKAKYPATTPEEVLAGLREHYDEEISYETAVDVVVFENAVSDGDSS